MKKKIVVFTVDNDLSTDDVMLLLLQKDCEVIRLNIEDYVQQVYFSGDDSVLSYKNGTVNLKDVHSFWYRRPGGTQFAPVFKTELQWHYNRRFVEDEYKIIRGYINRVLQEKKGINCLYDDTHDKLQYLYEAKKLGLKVPEWSVVSNIKALNEFRYKHGKVITKTMNLPYLELKSGALHLGVAGLSTHLFSDADFEYLNSSEQAPVFYPTFIQKYIEKKCEIRTFYLDEKLYSMAIFSQQNEKTRIDYRNYDHDRPNRDVPFKLPAAIEDKLVKLVKKVNLNCCSMDIIYAPDNEFYFLEINPIGQFQWLSKDCNYNIEHKIADYLYE